MSSLLTPQETNEALEAFKDVTDTFFRTPIEFKQMKVPYSRMGNVESSVLETKNVNGRVTVKDGEKNKVVTTLQGIDDKQELEIRFNIEDLIAADLMTDFELSSSAIDISKDIIVFDNQEYKIRMITTDDTDFLNRLVIIVFTCEKKPKRT
jgi:hypothetical protein